MLGFMPHGGDIGTKCGTAEIVKRRMFNSIGNRTRNCAEFGDRHLSFGLPDQAHAHRTGDEVGGEG